MKKLLLPVGLPIVFIGLIMFARYMQYREENTLRVCVSPPFLSGLCGDVVATPGERLFLNEIVDLPENGPVVHNYWAEINGRNVAVDVEENGHNGVNLYVTVPQPEPWVGARSPLSLAQQLFQECINVGGHLYGLDEDGDGHMTSLANSTGDFNSYPCVVSGSLGPPYVMPATADDIGTDRNDMDANIH